MAYVGNFVALSAFIVLPFVGDWTGREIYAFNQTMGITMMGGFMSWLWIIQAILIGVLFLGSNYYLWLGMERIDRKSTRLNSSHLVISYAVFCLKKKKKKRTASLLSVKA